MVEPIKIFTTFTGIGSPEMALKNIGIDYEIVGISEVDKHALRAYDAIHNNQSESVKVIKKEEMLEEISKKNIAYNFSTGKSEIPKNLAELKMLYIAHKRSKNYGDIRRIDETSLPDFDFLTYSFPCKDISVAGNQKGLDKSSTTQSSLLWECERIIRFKKPRFLLMENVKNLVGKNHIQNFEKWVSVLEGLGYRSTWKVLNAKDFGVPQNRERVMMVSILSDNEDGFKMPVGKKLGVSVQDILEDKKDISDNVEIQRHKYQHIVEENIFSSKIIEESGKMLIQIGMLNSKGNDSNRRVYHRRGLSPTLNSMNGGNRQPKIMVGKDEVRKLTPLECWRLMGYKDEHFFLAKNIGGLSNSKLYERAGRGIAVPMLEKIFENMFRST